MFPHEGSKNNEKMLCERSGVVFKPLTE